MTTWPASSRTTRPRRPQLDDVSRGALDLGPAVAEPVPWYLTERPSATLASPTDTPDSHDTTTLEDVLWVALCDAPDDGADVAELMRATGMGRSTLYRYLAQLAEQGRADPGRLGPLARGHARGR